MKSQYISLTVQFFIGERLFFKNYSNSFRSPYDLFFKTIDECIYLWDNRLWYCSTLPAKYVVRLVKVSQFPSLVFLDEIKGNQHKVEDDQKIVKSVPLSASDSASCIYKEREKFLSSMIIVQILPKGSFRDFWEASKTRRIWLNRALSFNGKFL